MVGKVTSTLGDTNRRGEMVKQTSQDRIGKRRG